MESPFPSLDATTLLIRQRRSVKPVDMDPARPLDRSLVETLLENATWAPNHGLTEPWRFDVFEGDARQRLASNLQSIYREATPEGEFREDKFAKLGVNPTLPPIVVACSMVRGSNPKIPAEEEVQALACALQNVMLSAEAAGLGSFWSSPPLLGAAPMNAFLGLGSQDRCIGLMYLGYAKADAPRPLRTRTPLGEKMRWHRDA